jgi:hypothetical protein
MEIAPPEFRGESMGTPVVAIYVPHSKDCPYKEDEFWKRCTCWKHLRWRHDGKQHRRATKSRTWAGAEREKREVELSYEAALNGQPKTASEPVTVRQAIAMFTAKKAKRAKGTLTKYRQTLDRLQVFCDREGRFFVADVTESDLQRFQASWRFGSAITERNHQERLRAFFRYCCASNEIRLPYNPTAQLEHIDISDREPTPPFTEKEYKSILSAIPEAGLTPKQQHRIRGMILVMRHAGLSIQDAAILEKGQIHKSTGEREGLLPGHHPPLEDGYSNQQPDLAGGRRGTFRNP